LRAVAEAIRVGVEWDGATKSITLSKVNTSVKLEVGNRSVMVNGKERQVDTTAVIKNNFTFVPLRLVAEALGAQVFWIEELGEVRILYR